jgi:hypothetical protein
MVWVCGYSRETGANWTHRYPLIQQAAHALRASSFLLDGEAVNCNENGLPDFDMLRHRTDHSSDWLKLKEPDSAAARREAETGLKRTRFAPGSTKTISGSVNSVLRAVTRNCCGGSEIDPNTRAGTLASGVLVGGTI